MGLIVSDKGGRWELVPQGVHLSRCRAIVDLGTHTNTYQGQTSDRHQVWIQWEHPHLRIEIEKEDGTVKNLPRSSSAFFTLSLNEKAKLRKMLDTWRGRSFTIAELKSFDLQNILGKPCQILITHTPREDGSMCDGIAAIMACPNGVVVPELEQEQLWFSLQETSIIPENIPHGIAEIIRQSREWRNAQACGVDDPDPAEAYEGEEHPPAIDDDNLPF